MSSAPSEAVKVILCGDSAVGKSKLVERFLMDQYNPQQLSTYALTLFSYKANLDGKEVNVDFWDTAGQERFNKVHPSYYHRAHICILVFDITRKVTYKNLEKWYKELMEYRRGIPCIVVGNKIDLDYKITQKSFGFAEKHGFPFVFVSASDGTNVVKVFTDAIKLGLQCRDNPPKEFYDEVMDLLNEDDDALDEKTA
uniref:RABL2 n=1 Tax=Andalucia godoyi TaxID=505711 RepID=A0A125SEA4_ANDGO|nr:RABL2 [Andalucia godoyi]|eukprot:ANDGO_04808.mRNA.1 Ras-related protein YPT3